jgi:hypothetical protein
MLFKLVPKRKYLGKWLLEQIKLKTCFLKGHENIGNTIYIGKNNKFWAWKQYSSSFARWTRGVLALKRAFWIWDICAIMKLVGKVILVLLYAMRYYPQYAYLSFERNSILFERDKNITTHLGTCNTLSEVPFKRASPNPILTRWSS